MYKYPTAFFILIISAILHFISHSNPENLWEDGLHQVCPNLKIQVFLFVCDKVSLYLRLVGNANVFLIYQFTRQKDSPFLNHTLTVNLCPNLCVFFMVSTAIQRFLWFLYPHLIVFYAPDHAPNSFFNLKITHLYPVSHPFYYLPSLWSGACVGSAHLWEGLFAAQRITVQSSSVSLCLSFWDKLSQWTWGSHFWGVLGSAHHCPHQYWGHRHKSLQLAFTANTFILYTHYYMSKFNLFRIK